MEKIKQLFDLIKKNGEKITSKMHVINASDGYDPHDLEVFKIYHSEGYYFEVSKERIDLAEDEQCETIDGYYYNFDSSIFEGFKELNKQQALKLIS